MAMVRFTGEHYQSTKYSFSQPGEYEVPQAKAEQLVRDFPSEFELGEMSPEATPSKPSSENTVADNQPAEPPADNPPASEPVKSAKKK